MKAIINEQYGSPDVLKISEMDKPAPKENEVLVQIKAVSLNASDWEFLTGKPFYIRMWGLFKPKVNILGSDIAGVVETVGKDVKNFKVGDAVFGDNFERWGGFAEYVCIPEDKLTLKPAELSFEQTAAIPQSALVALQGLRDVREIKPGQKILINGAGGGSGSFAIQIAKYLGAQVIAVDSTEKLELMRSLGADFVIDYTKEDFTKNGQHYDLVLDLVASHSIFDYKRSLAKNGIYIMVGGTIGSVFNTLVLGSLISIIGSKKMTLLAHKPNKDMDFILKLIESGKVKTVIDTVYPFEKIAEAMRHLGEGHAKGKVVIKIEESVSD